MSIVPPFPEVPPEGAGKSPVVLRYEDIAQNGRFLVEALATGVNESLWGGALAQHPIAEHAARTGIHTILSRFVLESTPGPFGVEGRCDAECRYWLARSVDDQGAVERLYLNAWIEMFAPIGRTNFPAPKNAGERVVAGRAFAEHVFTKPFAKAGERKVTSIPFVEREVPELLYTAARPDALLAPTVGSTPLDASLVVDETVLAFGLRHTDSNQHVNSLVYPQLFEDAALRRMRALGLGTERIARSVDLAYRKPCFAGQEARIALALFEDGASVGAYGGFYDAGELARDGVRAKPNAYVRMLF
jgi:hypothetical protein